MDRAPDSQPKPAPDGPAFRASPYGHRWSEFDPSLGKTVWRRDSLKKKRRRSVHTLDAEPEPELRRSGGRSEAEPQLPPPPPARDPKMEIAFLLNHQGPDPRRGGPAAGH